MQKEKCMMKQYLQMIICNAVLYAATMLQPYNSCHTKNQYLELLFPEHFPIELLV